MSIEQEIIKRQIELESNKAYLESGMTNPIRIRIRQKRIMTLVREIKQLQSQIIITPDVGDYEPRT